MIENIIIGTLIAFIILLIMNIKVLRLEKLEMSLEDKAIMKNWESMDSFRKQDILIRTGVLKWHLMKTIKVK